MTDEEKDISGFSGYAGVIGRALVSAGVDVMFSMMGDFDADKLRHAELTDLYKTTQVKKVEIKASNFRTRDKQLKDLTKKYCGQA